MESNDSEVTECLNFLRPPVRRDYKKSGIGYSNNFYSQPNNVNYLSEWRRPKKRKSCHNRLRRGLETSTSLIWQKKSSDQIFDSTAGVVSYTCLPNTRIQKTTQYQVTAKKSLKQKLKDKDDKPVIQVIVIPNEEGENQIQKHKVPKVTNNYKNLNSIETKNIYVVVVDKDKDKIYEIKNIDTTTVAEEVNQEDVDHVFNDRFKQIVKSLIMEKKHNTDNNHEMVKPTENACKCSSKCGTQITGCCEDKTPSCLPAPCKPPPCKSPCPPPHTIVLQDCPPIAVGVGNNKVTIRGQLGINEDDRFVMKCAATIDDKPVIPEFFHIGAKASPNRELVDDWEFNETNGPEKSFTIMPSASDKLNQCACRRTNKNEQNYKSDTANPQSPVVVISVFPKDHEGISKLIQGKQHVIYDYRKPAPSQYENDDNYYTGQSNARRMNNFTQDSQSQLKSHNVSRIPRKSSNVYIDKHAQSNRPCSPRQANYEADGRDISPCGRRRTYEYNDQEIENTRPRITRDFSQDYERSVRQDVSSQVMGLKHFKGGQIVVSHSSVIEPRITRSNYTQNNNEGRTRNTFTQHEPGNKKEQRFPPCYARMSADKDEQKWVPSTETLHSCVNQNCTKECLNEMIRDHDKFNKQYGSENKNKSINSKNNKVRNRSPSPFPKNNKKSVNPHIVETSTVKRNRSKSPSPRNISNTRETKKTVSSKQKTKTSATTSGNAFNTKKPNTKAKDKTNISNKSKFKTVNPENYKKIVNDRVDEYNRLSPKHDVSKISVNIDSENEYYDVQFHQGPNRTGVTVRKTVKENRHTDSLQNLFCKSKTLCNAKSASDFPSADENKNQFTESSSRFNVRDSLELSHRHSQKMKRESDKKGNIHFSVSNEDLGTYAPIKHFTGDDCTIYNPIERDKEIRTLLGIPRRINSKTKDSQTHTLFGDRSFIVQPFTNESKCKPVTVNCCSCCCLPKDESRPVDSFDAIVKHKKAAKHKCECHKKNKKEKQNEKNIYTHLILNRNIQVFLQVEQFSKEKPICLSKKQYDKVKKTIQSQLSKNKQFLAKKEKDTRRPSKESKCCNVNCLPPPVEAKCSNAKVPCPNERKPTHKHKKFLKAIKHGSGLELKISPKTTEECCQPDCQSFIDNCCGDDSPIRPPHICCPCLRNYPIQCMQFEDERIDYSDKSDKKAKEMIQTSKSFRQCPCIQSLISIGEVRLKTGLLDDNKELRPNYQKLDENLLEDIDVEQENEDVNFDLSDDIDYNDDEYLDPSIMAPCEKAWLEYQRFQNQEKRLDTVILYKREKPNQTEKQQTMSSMEVRYTNVSYKQVTYASGNVVDSLVSDSSLALKDPVSVETLFKGHTKSRTPNLGTSTMSYISEPSCPETPPCHKPAKKPFLKRLMSCLVMRSEKVPGQNLTRPRFRAPTAESSLDSYHFSTSLGAIEMTSSLYDTSASFYTNHSVLPQYTKMSKRGFLNSVRGFLYNRWS